MALMIQTVIKEGAAGHGYHEVWDIALDAYLNSLGCTELDPLEKEVPHDAYLAAVVQEEVRVVLAATDLAKPGLSSTDQ